MWRWWQLSAAWRMIQLFSDHTGEGIDDLWPLRNGHKQQIESGLSLCTRESINRKPRVLLKPCRPRIKVCVKIWVKLYQKSQTWGAHMEGPPSRPVEPSPDVDISRRNLMPFNTLNSKHLPLPPDGESSNFFPHQNKMIKASSDACWSRIWIKAALLIPKRGRTAVHGSWCCQLN